MKKFNIIKPDQVLASDIDHKIDFKTKPQGSLGLLESIGKKICLIQQRLSPSLNKPSIIVFAGDHGLAKEGVSAYPPEVTHQMVLNFLSGGAAINVFSQQHDINLQIVDAGVDHMFNRDVRLLDKKIANGTQNSLKSDAISIEQLNKSLLVGADLSNVSLSEESNIIGFGEMGIGNTSAASLLMSAYLDIPIEQCIGKGTGVDQNGLEHKTNILSEVFKKHQSKKDDTLEFFRSVAGFEMAMMLGGMLQAAENKMVILVDGFIASSVFLTAYKLYPEIINYGIFCHQSDEQGHNKILTHLNAIPILKMKMRLGEGSGCALAYPIIESSCKFINEMASFDSAAVSQKT